MYNWKSGTAAERKENMPRGSNLPSVMTKDFSRVPAPQIQRSVFNRSHGHKTTFDAGLLVPFLVEEILPGDTMNVDAQIFARLSTMIFPIMDNVFLDTFYFFVPNRLVWTNWERFQGAQDDPGDSTDYEVPVISGSEGPGSFNVFTGDLADYFGLPLGGDYADADCPNALPFRAYNLIWNEWFRDENLQQSIVNNRDDGPDSVADYQVRYRGKRHDYFTSALPWPQRGDAVSIALGTSAPVIGNGTTLGLTFRPGAGHDFGLVADVASGNLRALGGNFGDPVWTAADGSALPNASRTLAVTAEAESSGLIADLSNATAATINDLRYAIAVQQILETDARGGTRYVEHLKAHWGVTSPDFRLQRPEYLGGSSQRVDVRGVPQTSSTDATSPQGNLSAYSQVGNRSGFNKSFVEHGYVIGLVNVRADITYQDGIHRMWTRRTRFDFYMPQLAHLGEQAILNREIYHTPGDSGLNSSVWGYQERWAEYRYGYSRVSGKFRSDATGSLDAWHLAIDYDALPVLNASFIPDTPPMDRVVAVETEPKILMDSFISLKHARPMPVYSIPGLQRL